MSTRQLILGLSPSESELYAPDRLCVGDFNRIAVAALDAFGTAKGSASLVIAGPAKSGKTHLLKGFVMSRPVRCKVAYLAPERFIGKTGASLRTFFAPYEKADIVCIDDLDRIRDENCFRRVFHLFNILVAKDRHMLVAMRDSPAKARHLPDYLATRLLSGMVTLIDRPDDAQLGAILRKLAGDRQIALTPRSASYILERSARSIPALAALLDRLGQTLGADGKRIGLQHIQRVLQ